MYSQLQEPRPGECRDGRLVAQHVVRVVLGVCGQARLKEFAEDAAGEYEIPESRHEDFVKASQLSTHRLVIVTLAAVLGGQHENMEDKLGAYLASSEFKVGIR
ncbi:hypothetical protein B0H14DRAFT_2620940 [Mycena olivaceomarginata]|nr:hypothetical protein B0H14DRAFT_2620940 [Mycena olivaceomarginata]